MQYRFDKHSILDILLPFFFVVCILSIQTFHWSTHKTVWQDYRVLFTPCTKDISKVIQLLTKAGVTGAISAESVEERFFSDDVHIPCFTQQEQYLQWFENKNDNLSYIYIPKNEYVPLSFLKSLHDNNISFYMEGNLYLSIANLLSCIILFISLLCFSSRYAIFFFSALPYLLLSPLVNGIVILTSILIFITATFYMIEILFSPFQLEAEQKKERYRENIIFCALLILAIFLSFFDSILFFVYIILSFLASLCAIYVIGKFQHLFEKEKEANRVHKKPIFYSFRDKSLQRLMSTKKMVASAFLLIICYVLPIIFFLFFFLPLGESYGSKLSIPTPSTTTRYKDFSLNSFIGMCKNKTEEMMPCLINYLCDEWAKSSASFELSSEKYQIDSEIVRDFLNDDFIGNCLDNLRPNSIEKLLLSEGGFVCTFYTFKFFPVERLQLMQLVISLLSIFASLAIILFKVVR